MQRAPSAPPCKLRELRVRDHYVPRAQGVPHTVLARHHLQCQYATHTSLVLGGGSSELVGGTLLGEVLQPAADMLQQQVQLLRQGQPAPPTALHTSVGTSAPLLPFLAALKAHLPSSWQREHQWGALP